MQVAAGLVVNYWGEEICPANHHDVTNGGHDGTPSARACVSAVRPPLDNSLALRLGLASGCYNPNWRYPLFVQSFSIGLFAIYFTWVRGRFINAKGGREERIVHATKTIAQHEFRKYSDGNEYLQDHDMCVCAPPSQHSRGRADQRLQMCSPNLWYACQVFQQQRKLEVRGRARRLVTAHASMIHPLLSIAHTSHAHIIRDTCDALQCASGWGMPTEETAPRRRRRLRMLMLMPMLSNPPLSTINTAGVLKSTPRCLASAARRSGHPYPTRLPNSVCASFCMR